MSGEIKTMFIIDNYPAAVICCIVTMLCWGSWANTQKLAASHWRFELFYWDYVLGILLVSLVFAFTLGSNGSVGRSFMADISQAGGNSIGSAIIGGIVFSAANILLGAAIAIAGMAVAFPVGIGLALVIGVVVNYIAHPIGDVGLLAGGVGLIVIAILLNAFAYGRMQAAGKQRSSRGLVLAVVCRGDDGLFLQICCGQHVRQLRGAGAGKAVSLYGRGPIQRRGRIEQSGIQYAFDEEAVCWQACSIRRLFQGRIPEPYHRDIGRWGLVSGNVVQYPCLG